MTTESSAGVPELHEDRLAAYFGLMDEMRPGRRPGNLRFYLSYLFDEVSFVGAKVLDVGAGDGRYSLYAACAGARRVVGLEPEAAGSASGVAERFRAAAEGLGVDNVQIVPSTLQDYEPAGERFDIVLLNASINHLDEDACVRLHQERSAQERYVEIFRKMAALTEPGGVLVISDCGRHNLARRLPERMRFQPWMEWDKHQQPGVWIELMEQAGFDRPRVRWNSPNSLRSLGRVVMGNRLVAYCTTSSFCLTMRRAGVMASARS